MMIFDIIIGGVKLGKSDDPFDDLFHLINLSELAHQQQFSLLFLLLSPF